ncbi:MAG TPA: amino acid adenylation domain-containing protein, partial [Pyrinomonadaceae bacterium]|nr:amino acid adenylation domain-containing protein [Pyrinomonadaceae bacterium]
LMRVKLLRLSEQEHMLVLAMHHIISDGWSAGVFFKELSALYAAYAAGEESPLQELPVQYADYAVWQRDYLRGEVLNAQVEYWRERLTGAAPVLELPADRVRPVVQSYRGAAARFEVSREVSEGLKELAHAEGVTLFMTLLAAFKVLLYRYTGQEDIVVGSPIAGRTRAEVEHLIGFFVNTLVLRTDLSGGPSFRELLGRVRETALGAYAHQDVPFEKLVEELQPERDMSHTPLFQVLFVLQNASLEQLHLEGLELHPLEVNSEKAKFDLTFTVVEESDGLRAILRYNTDLFEAATIERMMDHFQVLLEGILINPEKSVSQLPLLGEAESRQLLVEWNQTHVSYPAHSSIHELFERQVERTPEAIALICEEQSLSYEELNGRANQLAHQLRTLGVGPEVLVGILMERSVEMVVSLLAVLKAGGAYVPLDPQYPAERISFMLAETAAPVLLTQKRFLERLPEHDGITVCMDSDWKALADLWATHNLHNDGARNNAAYVIYTSGSTGKPKGVVVEHSSICNHLLWRQERYPLNAEDRFLHKASISFDIAVWEIFAPLISGARLVLAEPGGQQDAAYLVRVMADQQITMVHFGPAMLKEVLEEPELENCVSLRDVFCGGESITLDLQRRFFERSKARLHHQYGPTETTVDVIIRECREDDERQHVPIGRPIANTEIYILDQQLHPVPVGVAAQLFVGAMPLARGYLNRPDLTAGKFVPHPFSDVPGSRLYSTGDQARYLANGEIEFLGRVDNQVKVRGFRIELGEIAAALNSYEGVKEAVVIVREDVPGEKRLVAYVVGNLATNELRVHLKQRLPEYMAPSAFVYLDELPLTPNGKVDRKALPAPETDLSATSSIPPRTPVEEML